MDWKNLLQNIDLSKLNAQFEGFKHYMQRDAYDLDKGRLVFKKLDGQYYPKYTISGLDIYSIPGQDLDNYMENSGLWDRHNFNTNTNYYMVKNADEETYSLVPKGGNISNLIDYYLDSPTSPYNGFTGFTDFFTNEISRRDRLNYLNTHPNEDYIGGTPDEARDKFWKRDAPLRHATDSIANAYHLNPHSFRYRLSHEGFVDAVINGRNGNDYIRYDGTIIPTGSMPRNTFFGYNLLHTDRLAGMHLFGLDNVGGEIDSGKLKIKGEKYKTVERDFDGHKGVLHAEGATVADDMGMVAAKLIDCRNQVLEDFPGISDHLADMYSNIYYQRGRFGGRNYIKNKMIPDKFTPEGNYNFIETNR